MKVIILDHANQAIEICPVTEEEHKQYKEDWEMFLCDKGYSLNNLSYMVCDNDENEVPVYWYKESIPITLL